MSDPLRPKQGAGRKSAPPVYHPGKPVQPKAPTVPGGAPPVYRPPRAPAMAAPPVYRPAALAQAKAVPPGGGAPPVYRPALPQQVPPPPVYRSAVAVQQRKSSAPLMLKPGLLKRGLRAPASPVVQPRRPPVVQRTIVDLEGRQIWGTKIAGRVFDETHSAIKDEVHRLHSSTEFFPVASYEDLVAKIKSGHYSSSQASTLGDPIQGCFRDCVTILPCW
jgi:hypothetical protein